MDTATTPSIPTRERGILRVYLGAAPGVGKTVAMLDEGNRRAARGTDVVIGVVETHGRPHTGERRRDLPAVPLRFAVDHQRGMQGELNVEAVLARRPGVVLVDALEHTNAPGAPYPRRWQEVDALLAAGLNVITTLNVQHIESLRDVVERITGSAPTDTVPDSFVRQADQIELVDMSPEALRRRVSHGNVFPKDQVDTALETSFRAATLGALRELALLWVADRVDAGLSEDRERGGITDRWETRERIVVALTGAPDGERLIRRASRLAARARGDLLGVHIRSGKGAGSARTEAVLDRHRELLAELGGTYHEVTTDDDLAGALTSFARSRQATQLVLGSSGTSRWSRFTGDSFIAKTIREAADVDVLVVARADAGTGQPGRPLPAE